MQGFNTFCDQLKSFQLTEKIKVFIKLEVIRACSMNEITQYYLLSLLSTPGRWICYFFILSRNDLSKMRISRNLPSFYIKALIINQGSWILNEDPFQKIKELKPAATECNFSIYQEEFRVMQHLEELMMINLCIPN